MYRKHGLSTPVGMELLMLQALISPVTNLLARSKNRAEKAAAKHKLEISVLENKARLALAEHEANSEWEMAQLQDKDKILRWFSYTMFTAPIVITVITRMGQTYIRELGICTVLGGRSLDRYEWRSLGLSSLKVVHKWSEVSVKNNSYNHCVTLCYIILIQIVTGGNFE